MKKNFDSLYETLGGTYREENGHLMRLSHKYEVEQEELKKQMFELKNKLERLDTAQNSSSSFIRAIRKFMTMQTLTPIVLQELIDKIEVLRLRERARTERNGSSSITVS